MQATTTSETKSGSLHRGSSDGAGGGGEVDASVPQLRRRSSSSLGLQESELPAVMQVVGAVNEDGLGLISWWSS